MIWLSEDSFKNQDNCDLGYTKKSLSRIRIGNCSHTLITSISLLLTLLWIKNSDNGAYLQLSANGYTMVLLGDYQHYLQRIVSREEGYYTGAQWDSPQESRITHTTSASSSATYASFSQATYSAVPIVSLSLLSIIHLASPIVQRSTMISQCLQTIV